MTTAVERTHKHSMILDRQSVIYQWVKNVVYKPLMFGFETDNTVFWGQQKIVALRGQKTRWSRDDN